MLVLLACVCNETATSPAPVTPTAQPKEGKEPFDALSPTVTPKPLVLVATPSPMPPAAVVEQEMEDALLVNLYRRVNPAVVYIKVYVEHDDGSLEWLASGSGFVVDGDGHIVTNNHVLEDADRVRVTFPSGYMARAAIVGRDGYSDLAVLQVDAPPEQLMPLELGDSDLLQIGQRVIAIGNPFGLEGTMTVGIVSALGRVLPTDVVEGGGHFTNPEIIQTDAAINPGNSGGPLLDTYGRVVGVNTAIFSWTGTNAGVGFAIPVNTVKRVVPALISEGVYHYPYLGISSNTYFDLVELAGPLNLPVTTGVLIAEVRPDSAAAEAGLRGGDHEVMVMGQMVEAGGDIITAIDGYEVRDFYDLIAYLVRETQVGQEVVLSIIRDGRAMEVPVTLGERPAH